MTETRTIHDPFLGKDVEISSNLVDRLRGRYASGPTMPNGEPEFGWREFPTPPIQHAAADEIIRLRSDLERAMDSLGDIPGETLDERLTTFIGYYMAMQIEVPKARADLERARKALEDLDLLLDFSNENMDSIWTFEDTSEISAAFAQARAALTEIAHN